MNYEIPTRIFSYQPKMNIWVFHQTIKNKIYSDEIRAISLTGLSIISSLGIIVASNQPISDSRPNIVFIQVDQIRPDHLDSMMASLMSLANNGVIFL